MQKGELFSTVKLKKPNTNAFDLSHQVLTTGNMGDLIPIYCQEVVPGDRFRVRSEIFCRLMPMLAPIMQRVDIYTHYFFVPNRLLWNISKQSNSWQAFITGGKDGTVGPETGCIPPYMEFSRAGQTWDDALSRAHLFDKGSLWDYFGLPTIPAQKYNAVKSSADNLNVTNGLTWSGEQILLYPFIAYQLIYDEYYRDQNYTDPVLDSDNVRGGMYNKNLLERVLTLRKRAWKKDYFTSALPWSQRGGKMVDFPIGISAPVSGNVTLASRSLQVDSFTGIGASSLIGTGFAPMGIDTDNSDSVVALEAPLGVGSGSIAAKVGVRGTNMFDTVMQLENATADLRNATAVTVEMLREGLRLQEWLERNAVGGARYVEQIYAHFGVMVPDATMQRPIYLGGGKQTIRISEVLQSVDTQNGESGSPLGEMAGHGISVGRTQGFNGRQFTEHGYIIGILSVVPKASYMNGINRSWTRFDKLDYYFPEFAHLGEQEVKIKELNFRFDRGKTEASSLPNRNDDTFGYQSRYAEYKYFEDKVSGEFRDTLLTWHLGRNFDPMDQFENNNDFLEINSEETERIFAVNDDGVTHKLLFQIYNDVQAIRPMPQFATPYI